jgi:uncharacterized membrane protein YdjX (TVP38/TMEM64 family)
VKLPRWQKLAVLLLWLGVVVAFWAYAAVNALTPRELLTNLLGGLQDHALAPPLLLFIYLLRPLLLLPTTLLTLASGFLFGPIWGFLYASAASLLSSSVAYGLGRFFAGGAPEGGSELLRRLRERSFETVLLSRLLALPGDLVNYASGFLGVRVRAFFLATAIGGAPGLLVGALAGASLGGDLEGGVRLNVPYLVASAVILLLSLALSQFLRRRGATSRSLPSRQ